LRKWIEQDYLNALFQSLREVYENGPVYLQFNQGPQAFVVKVMFYLAGITCKQHEFYM
jgi:hypothetical protein